MKNQQQQHCTAYGRRQAISMSVWKLNGYQQLLSKP